MLTLLLYVLIVGLVAALLFLVASAVFGRGEELGPLPEGTTVTVLPAQGISGSDVRALRFQQVVRGYKAGEVDWALTRLAARIDELESQLAQARGEVAGAERDGAAQHAYAGAAAPTPAIPAGNGAGQHAVGFGQGTGVGHVAGTGQAAAAEQSAAAPHSPAAGSVPAPRRVPAAEPGPADLWMAGQPQAGDAPPLPRVLAADGDSESVSRSESGGGNGGVSPESEGRGTAR